MKWAGAPGNVSLSARLPGLPKDSVANVSQIVRWTKICSPNAWASFRAPSWN
jgi:hypothetical protein